MDDRHRAALALCLWPRTSIFGAILLTAYLGGAIATYTRVGSPPTTWLAIWLRSPELRALIPLTKA